MSRSAAQAGLSWMVLASLGVHVAAVGLAVAIVELGPRLAPPPQTVLVTKLVRLGTPRPKELLPRKEEPPPPPPPPPPAPAVPQAPAAPARAVAPPKASAAPPAPQAAQGPSARDRVSALSRTSKTLERLKQQVDGQKDGAVDGDVSDADLAVAGNTYATELQRCVKSHYEVQGSDPTKIANLKAEVLVRIAPDGSIMNFKVEGSGVAAFDQAVGRAIVRCGRISAPPAILRQQVRTDGIVIEFQP